MEKVKLKEEIKVLITSAYEQALEVLKKEKVLPEEIGLLLHTTEKTHEKLIVFNYLNNLPIDTYSEDSSDTYEPIVEQKEQFISPEEVHKEVSKDEIKKEKVKQEEKEPTLFSEPIVIPTIKPKEEVKTTISPSPTPKTKVSFDLKSLIGLNDRFLFANDLFGGNMNDFNIAINQLNDSESKESIEDYMLSLDSLYNWDKESDSYIRFLQIVSRKFAK